MLSSRRADVSVFTLCLSSINRGTGIKADITTQVWWCLHPSHGWKQPCFVHIRCVNSPLSYLSALCDFNPLTLCTCKILLPVRWNIREHLLVLSCVRRRPIDAVVYVNKGRYRFSQEQLYEKTTWWQARQSGVCICLCAWLKAAPLCTNYICLSWSAHFGQYACWDFSV